LFPKRANLRVGNSGSGLGKLQGEPLSPLLGGPAGFLVNDGFGVGALVSFFHGEPPGFGDRVGRVVVGLTIIHIYADAGRLVFSQQFWISSGV